MADINKIIGVQIDDNASAGLNKVDQSLTKVTQSTKNLTQETKSHTQSVLDNGGAMGLLNELTGGLAMTFKDASEAIGLAGVSLKGFRGVLLATGIGALVVVLGELINNWDKWSKVIDGSAEAMERFQTQQAIFISQRQQSNITATETIGVLEQELRLLEAQGASMDLILQKQNEISIARKNQAKLDVETYTNELKKLEKYIQEDFLEEAAGMGEEAALKFYATNPLVKQRSDLQEKLVQAQIAYNTALNDPKVREAEKNRLEREKEIERSKKAQLELDKERLKLLSQLSDSAKQQADILKKAEDSTKSLFEGEENIGEIEKKYKALGNTYMDVSKAQKELQILLDKQIKLFNSIKNPTQEQIEQNNKFIESIDKGNNSINGYIKSLGDYYQILEKNSKEDIYKNDLIIERENKILPLKLKSIELNSTLLDFEKSLQIYGDNRLDNSNKYKEIEKRILDIEINRKTLLDETLGVERTQAKEKLNNLAKEEIELAKTVDNLKKQLGETSQDDDNFDVLFQKYTETRGKLLQKRKEFSDAEVQYNDISNNYIIELAGIRADTEIDLEINKNNTIESLRAERLERERMYYESSVGIAEEAAGFFNALAAQGDKNSKKYAETALKIQKAAGVARVAIALQEEIRGIWSNPSLTAIPDTGASAKTLLTIGASARAALSVATILSQKIQDGGASLNNASGGAAPQAQFNIVGSSGTNQLAATIGAQQNQTVNAYVVGSDVSTQQSLDRNRVNNATFLVNLITIGLLFIFI